MTKYRNKYRIDSTQLKNWDYKQEGIYFVTICTKNREHFFGHINNGKMILSDMGKIVELEWEKTFVLRKDMNLKMGEYIVMPNHFHAIIVIGKNQYNNMSGREQCIASLPGTHLVLNPKIWHLLFVGLNHRLPPLPEKTE